MNDTFELEIQSLSESYPTARHLIADILICDIFPKLVSKCMLDKLNDCINSTWAKPWHLPQIDSFINSLFIDYLPSSKKLQSTFQIDRHSLLISLFLKKRSTQLERVDQLVNKIDKIFFLNENVQRIILCSQQHRSLIDDLIQDDKCVTLEKLSNEQTQFVTNLQSETKNIILPGLNINILNSYSHHLTGKQQEHITKIILHDFLQVDISIEKKKND